MTNQNYKSTVLIAGGTGLIGSRLSRMLQEQGYQVLHLSRRKNPNAEFPAYSWDVEKGIVDEEAVQKADFIINLAGAGIAEKRWTESRKKLIIDSRVQSALLLKNSLAKKTSPLKAYLSASAIGYYGNRGEEWLRENDPPGKKGFLSESVQAWENSIRQVEATGVRTVAFRIGVVLSTQGGALKEMLLSFKFFVGTYFGNGRQWYSWIHIEDLCRMFIEAIENERFAGIYNAVAPQPERNKDFVLAIKKALKKPALVLPAPAFALRLALGEMADAVLGGSKVSSEKVRQAGFQFQFPELQPALEDVFRRKI
ncbi:MAG: TIGR01777 family oxidoreductase [Bacteroidota bacterium]